MTASGWTSKGVFSNLESAAPQMLLADGSGVLLCSSVIHSCLLKRPTAREFPFVFSWLSLLWHALLFLHSVSILKFPQASLQMKHCITEEVKPLKVNAFAKHLEQIQSVLIYPKWTCKLTLQNLGRTIGLSWAVWCSFSKSWAVLLFFCHIMNEGFVFAWSQCGKVTKQSS